MTRSSKKTRREAAGLTAIQHTLLHQLHFRSSDPRSCWLGDLPRGAHVLVVPTMYGTYGNIPALSRLNGSRTLHPLSARRLIAYGPLQQVPDAIATGARSYDGPGGVTLGRTIRLTDAGRTVCQEVDGD